jgi:hypothetical protein
MQYVLHSQIKTLPQVLNRKTEVERMKKTLPLLIDGHNDKGCVPGKHGTKMKKIR